MHFLLWKWKKERAVVRVEAQQLWRTLKEDTAALATLSRDTSTLNNENAALRAEIQQLKHSRNLKFKHPRNHKYVESTSAALATRHGFTSTDNLMLHHTTTSTYNE